MNSNTFIVGCNYWASNAGAEMWNKWDETSVEDDIKTLSQNGIRFLRVFPNWRDFQPVYPVPGIGGELIEYRLKNDEIPDNPYYLKREMLDKFKRFCSLCGEYGVELIVSLITGWMSGRLFIPPVLYQKNLICDSVAVYFEQLFIQGFVGEFKKEKSIIAWDIGNECGCMSDTQRYEEAAVWTKAMSDAVRAADGSRPVISGIHELTPSRNDSPWTITCQAVNCDVLVTHPYPFWSKHAKFDCAIDLSTLFYPSAIGLFYSRIGNKPYLTEEIGTMGPSVASDDVSRKFMDAQLYSAWENGSGGVMWWCAHEQDILGTLPYTWNMCETELGLFDKYKNPKPIVGAIKEFNEFLESVDFELPSTKSDALCISTHGQDQLGISYAGYVLAKQAGFDIDFAFCTNACVDDGNVYMLPSYRGINVMPKEKYIEILDKVYNGAMLYISYDGGILSDFRSVTGLEVIANRQGTFAGEIELNGKKITYTQNFHLELKPCGADVLVHGKDGEPVVTANKYGKGTVYFVSFSPEENVLDKPGAFDSNMHEVYKFIFDDIIRERPVKCKSKNLFVTNHCEGKKLYCVVSNYSDECVPLNLEIRADYSLEKIYNAKNNCVKPYQAAVVLLGKEKTT